MFLFTLWLSSNTLLSLHSVNRNKVKNSIRLELVYRDGRQYKISGVSGSSMTKPIDKYELVYAKWSMRHEASVDGLKIGTSTKLLFASGVGKIHVKITVVLRSLIIPSPRRLRLSFIMLFAL